MGQQQLLLLVLSAIIVGVSVVIGINMFSQSAGQANQDAVLQDIMTISSRAQEWYRKPTLLGGGGRTFVGMTLADLNFVTPNNNGSYTLSGLQVDQFTVTGLGLEDQDNDGNPLQIQVVVEADTVNTPTFLNR
ncbi:MAG: hypothetical protein ACE5JB_01250 [bacterium]